jgi:hypothetical protein
VTTRGAGLVAAALVAVALAAGTGVATWHVVARSAAVERAKAAERTRPRSLDGMRARDQAHQRERTRDMGFEACGAFGRPSLAHRLGLAAAAAPAAIAEAFAAHYPHDVRGAFRSGCLQALTTGEE